MKLIVPDGTIIQMKPGLTDISGCVVDVLMSSKDYYFCMTSWGTTFLLSK